MDENIGILDWIRNKVAQDRDERMASMAERDANYDRVAQEIANSIPGFTPIPADHGAEGATIIEPEVIPEVPVKKEVDGGEDKGDGGDSTGYTSSDDTGYVGISPEEAKAREINNLTQVAQGNNPYVFDPAKYQINPMTYAEMQKMLPASSPMAQTIGQKLTNKPELPTDMTDPLYKMKLAVALRDRGRWGSTINEVLQDESLNDAIRRERINAFQKAVGGMTVGDRDFELSNLASQYPKAAAMLAGRMPSSKDIWNYQNSLAKEDRANQQYYQRADYNNQLAIDRAKANTNLALEKYGKTLGIKNAAEMEQKLAYAGILGQAGYSPKEALQIAFGSKGTRNASSASNNSTSKLSKEQTQFASEMANGIDAALEQVRTHDMSAEHLSSMRSQLEKAYAEHKISPEYYNNYNQRLYMLEEAWKGGEPLSNEEFYELKKKLGYND